MKRIIISLLLSVVVWGVAQAQSTEPTFRKIYVSSELGYPLSPASSLDGTLHTGVLSARSIDINSLLPQYKIGGVPNQQMWNDKDFFGFYVSTDTLDLTEAELTYTVDGFPSDKIDFNAQTGKFIFYPDSTDITGFTLTLIADAGDGYIVSQDVYFGVVPTKGNMFDYLSDKQRDLPDSDNYFTITKTKKVKKYLNGEVRDTLYSYSISGVEIILNSEASSSAKDLSMLNERMDLEELNIYAERLVVESPFNLYSTNLTIYADEIIFEQGASINTSATNYGKSGNVSIYAKNLIPKHPGTLFYMAANSNDSIGKMTSNIDGISHNGDGHYEDAPYKWLHPNWMIQTVGFLNDAFIDQQSEYVKSYCDYYSKEINDFQNSKFWATDNIELLELDGIVAELQSMNFKIRNNLDYFGNPTGFMPMLSFEVNQSLYKQEVDRSIRTLYFTYWMKNANKTIEERVAACKEAIKLEKEQLADNILTAKELSAASNMLQASMTDLVTKMDTLTVQLEKKTEELLKEAENNVDKYNKINTAKKIVAPCIKVAGTIVGAAIAAKTKNEKAAETGKKAGEIGAKVSDKIFDFFNPPLDSTYANKPPYEEFYKTLKSDGVTFAGSVSSYSNMLNKVNIDDLGSRDKIMDMGNNFKTASESMVKTISKFENAASKTSVTNEQIQTELNKLLAESTYYTDLIQKVSKLNDEKEEVLLQMFTTFNQLTSTVYNIQRGIVTIDALNVSEFEQKLNQDFKVMLYIDNLERNAKNRLLQSHYYMGRSYEYSFLKPYHISLNTDKLFERCKQLVSSGINTNLKESDFNSLKVIYENDLADVETKIIETFRNNKVPQSKKIFYTLNADQLKTLNSDSLNLTVNLFEDGKFPLNEADIRILDINIKSLDIDVSGEKIDPDRYFDLNILHEGNSRFIKDGKILAFTHKGNNDIEPIKWAFRCFQQNEIEKESMSPSSLSLLNSLLQKTLAESSVFAKPAAWGKLTFERRNEYNPKLMNINIKKLQLEIGYEKISSSSQQPAAFISVANNIQPDIQLIVNDVPTASVSGFYVQVLENKYSKLQLKAPQRFGEWDFVEWVNHNDLHLSENANYNAGFINENKYFRAVYQKKTASLEVDPAHNIPKEKGYMQIKVENGGSETLDWEASLDETWFKIKAGNKGLNNGYITIEFEDNDKKERKGILKISSNAGDKDVVIVQSGDDITNIENENLANQDYVTVYVRENGLCYVNLGQQASAIKVELYDLNGRNVKQLSLQNMRNFDFDISELTTGVYVFKVVYDGKISNHKIMK